MAANSMRIGFDLSGIGDLRKMVAELKPSAQSRILGDAINRAGKPIVSLARARVPRDTGALRASLGMVVRRYPERGIIMGLIGARRGYFRGGRRLKSGQGRRGANSPAHYSHLVEYGHNLVVGTGIRGATTKGGSIRKGTFSAKAYVLPRPFLRPAVEQGRGAADNALADGFGRAIEAELRRAKRKFTKATSR